MKIKQTIVIIALAIAVVGVAAPSVQALDCTILPQSICDASDDGELQDSSVWKLLMMGLRILTAGIGVTAVCALGYFSFLYATAGDNANQIKEAKDNIRNTIVGIILYGAMYLLLEYLVPGGVFT